MPKYCPVCLGEFQDNVKTCAKDDTALTSHKPASFDRLIDIYAASDEADAEHLIGLLDDEGIIARESMRGVSQLPSKGDTHFVIAVLRDDVKRAKTFIEQARRDGVISSKGSFIG